LVSSAVNSSENGNGTALAPRVLKLSMKTLFCITRSLMPSMSSSLVTARLLLVRLRKPFSQYTRPTRPFSCSLSITFWPTGPSSTASASLALLNRKGVSQIGHFLGDAHQRGGGADHHFLRAADQRLLHLHVRAQRGGADGAQAHLAARGLFHLVGEHLGGAALVGLFVQAVAETDDARLDVLRLGQAGASVATPTLSGDSELFEFHGLISCGCWRLRRTGAKERLCVFQNISLSGHSTMAGNTNQQRQHGEIDRQKRHHALDHRLHAQAAHAGHHVEHRAHRRCEQAQAAGEDEDEAEVHRVDAGLGGQRGQHRRQDQDGGREVHHHAHRQQEEADHGHEQHRVLQQRPHVLGQLAGQVGQGDHVGGGGGGATQEHHDAGGAAGIHQHAVQARRLSSR
jgi:hypothetical protein